MEFLVDECCGPVVANWLREQGHDARRVADISPGLDDADVLELAHAEARILVTNDKDFGARVFEKGESGPRPSIRHSYFVIRTFPGMPVIREESIKACPPVTFSA